MNEQKVLIAVPTFENIMPETFKSIYGLQSECILAFDYIKGYDCAKARNEIVKRAIEGGFDYLLMVDSDIIVPYNALDFLLESPNDLVVGVYPRKNTTIKDSELFKMTERDYTDRYSIDELNEIQKNGISRIKVKGSGMGCALIKVDVLRKLPFPYFRFVTYDDGEVLSEDLYFCHQITQMGGSIEADLRVRCGHLVRKYQYE